MLQKLSVDVSTIQKEMSEQTVLIKELQHERTGIATAQPSGVPHVEQAQDLRPPPPTPAIESQKSPVLVGGLPQLELFAGA